MPASVYTMHKNAYREKCLLWAITLYRIWLPEPYIHSRPRQHTYPKPSQPPNLPALLETWHKCSVITGQVTH